MSIIKKLNNTIFYSILSIIVFTLLPSCNVADMDSYELSLNDEEAVAAKGGYYYLEEEQEAQGKVAYPILEYFQTAEWSEKSYGTYVIHQDVTIKMNGSTITQKTTKKDVTCKPGAICNYEGSVTQKVDGSSEVKFIRSKSDDLKKVDNDQKAYDKASFIFLFVNSMKGISGSYSYDFSSPVPFLLRSDLSASSYKNKLAKDLTINYTYTSDNPNDPSGSAKLTAHLEKVGSAAIKIKVTNILDPACLECKDAKQNENKLAERYGSFPFPREILYIIDLDEGKKITEYRADTETLVTRFDAGSSSAYSQGNRALVHAETSLCKHKLSGKVQKFSCGK